MQITLSRKEAEKLMPLLDDAITGDGSEEFASVRAKIEKALSKKVRRYNPVECEVCGGMFTPNHGNAKYCPECQEVLYHNKGRRLPRAYAPPYDLEKYEEQTRKQNIEAYKDTIVAEGYADRQRAETLQKVEPIKITL